MFAKLKQKIEEGGTELTKELHNPKQNTGGSGSPLSLRRGSNLDNKYRGSNESLLSDSSSRNEAVVTSVQEFLGSLSAKSAPHLKEWESKIRQMTRALKSEVNRREKVERVLENQQDTLSKRIEERDEEWKEKMSSVIQEKELLQQRLEQTSNWMQKLADNQDAVEEFEGFQTQEISKLKHLLMLSQQEFSAVSDSLRLKEAQVELKTTAVASLTDENNALKDKIIVLENKDSSIIHGNESGASVLINDELLKIGEELERERCRCKQFEKDLSDLRDDYKALKEENESLQEKVSSVRRLEDTVASLEQRLQQANSRNQQFLLENGCEGTETVENVDPILYNGGHIPAQSSLNFQLSTNYESALDLKLKTVTDQLQNVEELLNISKEAEEISKGRNAYLEAEVSKFALETESVKLLNDKLSAELSSTKENLRKVEIELELSVEQVKQMNEDLGSAENEKQNLLVLLDELRESMKDAQHANSEASRLENLTLKLQDQITDKNKAIKLQQQQINDMKKALHRELRLQSCIDANSNDSSEKNGQHGHSFSKFSSSIGSSQRDKPASLSDKLDDVNFKYVKHVVLKYMTSTESEAHHLIKAIGVLLDFTNEEEQLVRETLSWKMSWFGSKPQLSRIHIGNRTIFS